MKRGEFAKLCRKHHVNESTARKRMKRSGSLNAALLSDADFPRLLDMFGLKIGYP